MALTRRTPILGQQLARPLCGAGRCTASTQASLLRHRQHSTARSGPSAHCLLVTPPCTDQNLTQHSGLAPRPYVAQKKSTNRSHSKLAGTASHPEQGSESRTVLTAMPYHRTYSVCKQAGLLLRSPTSMQVDDEACTRPQVKQSMS